MQQIKFFTAEAGLFVRNLKFFSNIENILINRQLVDLLSDAAVNISALIENANVIETPSGQNLIDLIFGFDEREYCLRRFLQCRSCGVSNLMRFCFACLFFIFFFGGTIKIKWCFVFCILQCKKLMSHNLTNV